LCSHPISGIQPNMSFFCKLHVCILSLLSLAHVPNLASKGAGNQSHPR
jgi:hypothetical protein